MRKPIRIPINEREKRKIRFDSIISLYENSSLEELKEVFNDKKHRSSTDKAALMDLTQKLMLKEKGIDKPIEINKELEK